MPSSISYWPGSGPIEGFAQNIVLSVVLPKAPSLTPWEAASCLSSWILASDLQTEELFGLLTSM
jgi:hypothetical protein